MIRNQGAATNDDDDEAANPAQPEQPPPRTADAAIAIKNVRPVSTERSALYQRRERDQEIPGVLEPAPIAKGRHGQQRDAAKQKSRENSVENGVARQREERGIDRQQQAGRQTDVRGRERCAQPPRRADDRERCESRHEPRGPFSRPEIPHRDRLQHVKEHRLIEERLIVVVRRDDVPAVDQLARGLGVMRFVGIPEAGGAEAPEQHDTQQQAPGNRGRQAAATGGTCGRQNAAPQDTMSSRWHSAREGCGSYSA